MLSIDPWNILWTVVNLLVLYLVFKKFLFKPVNDTKELMKNFIKEMCKLGYCDEMRDIFDSYYRIDDEANHILKAELISADSSDEDDNAKQAQDFLKSRYPDYTIELTKTVDADLLGGYVIRAHHKEYDRSFEGRFCQLERKLTGR